MGEVFKLNHCYNVDCVPAMELFPDNYFDLAVVDPPYFSGPERRGFYGSKVSKIGVHRDYPISPAWIRPGPEYFRELLRVSRHYIVWGCNYFDYKFATGRIVWDKCNGSSSFSDCEIAATDLFTSVRLFRYMWSGMMQGKSIAEGSTMQGNKSMNEKRIHPTQKPVVLYDWIFKNYVYAPNFTIYGSMNAEDLRSIMDEGYEKFCEYVERYEREKRRTQYGT